MIEADPLVELTDPLATALVPVPGDGPDVCPHCHTSKDEQYDLCYSCNRLREALGELRPPVIPISYYHRPGDGEPPSVLRDLMHDYKEHEDPDRREAAAQSVAAILARYLHEHGAALRERFGGWDLAAVVPSKKHTERPRLEVALGPYQAILGEVRPLLEAADGAIGRSQPNRQAFVTTTDVAGVSVLLMDDTFTTGATLHSAAEALFDHDATVVAAVVVVRKINPDPRWANTQQVWDRQSAISFDFREHPFWVTG